MLFLPTLSSGSDHNKSQIGPDEGISSPLFNFLISSTLFICGDNPPCTQNNYFFFFF